MQIGTTGPAKPSVIESTHDGLKTNFVTREILLFAFQEHLQAKMHLLFSGRIPSRYKILAQESVAASITRVSALQSARDILFQILQSAQFLYRSPVVQSSGVMTLEQLDLAERLAFFIWQSKPDFELLQVADTGRLKEENILRRQVSRLLADPRAHRSFRQFVYEWLQLARLNQINLPSSEYALFSRANLPIMNEQTLQFIENIAFDKTKPFTSIFNEPYETNSGPLARLYRTRRDGSSHDPSKVRSGFLSQLSVLSLTSAISHTDPVARGHYVTSRFLCVTVPPAPAGVPQLPHENKSVTKRERYKRHRGRSSLCRLP